MKTFRLTCSICGRSYRTDTRRGQAIKLILITQPDYIKKYHCKKCRKFSKPQVLIQSLTKQIDKIRKDIEFLENIPKQKARKKAIEIEVTRLNNLFNKDERRTIIQKVER